jgi:hypothetical protein
MRREKKELENKYLYSRSFAHPISFHLSDFSYKFSPGKARQPHFLDSKARI